MINPLDFTGNDIGEKTTNALLVSNGEKVVIPHGFYQFDHPFLIASEDFLDFNGARFEYLDRDHAITTALPDRSRNLRTDDEGQGVKECKMLNLNLWASGDSRKDIIQLLGFRSGIINNFRIAKSGDPADSGPCMFKLRSGDSGLGCHYNIIGRLALYGNSKIDQGLQIRASGSQSCNDNLFQLVMCSFQRETGIRVDDGQGNHFQHASVESAGGSNDNQGLGMWLRGKKTRVDYFYGENLAVGIDRRNDPGSSVDHFACSNSVGTEDLE